MQVSTDVDGSATAGEAAAETLKVVADPVRLRILGLLADEELCVCHLQDALSAGQTLVSHHLRVLRQAGLVEAQAHGRFVYYRLHPGGLDAVRDTVAALADAGRTRAPRRAC